MKKLLILGSTGSIGRQTLDVAAAHPKDFSVTALAAHRSVEMLRAQIAAFHPAMAAMGDEKAAEELQGQVDIPVFAGAQGILQMVRECGADICLGAMMGVAGLPPVMEAIGCGMDIALANKETLVTAGALVTAAAKEKGVALLPVDSEHSAIFQCIQGQAKPEELLLTASGGPFFGKKREEMEHITPEMALKHPTWTMGQKITIDSATMMNKALEIIEARWLFDMPAERIRVLVHRQSVVHSLVRFADHSVLAQLGSPDMRTAIQYALTYPERKPCPSAPLELTQVASLTFQNPDEDAFPCLALGRRALAEGKTVALNAASEVAVEAFLQGRLSFGGIARLVEHILNEAEPEHCGNVHEVFTRDAEIRAFARNKMALGSV